MSSSDPWCLRQASLSDQSSTVLYLGGATGLGDGLVSLGGFCGGKATGGNLLAGSFLGSYTTAISFELYPNIVPVKKRVKLNGVIKRQFYKGIIVK